MAFQLKVFMIFALRSVAFPDQRAGYAESPVGGNDSRFHPRRSGGCPLDSFHAHAGRDCGPVEIGRRPGQEKEKDPWLGKPRAQRAAIEVWVFGGGNSR
jgi:hypothetical protein